MSQPGILGRARRKLAIEHPLDLNHHFDSLVFIAGTARSGTTWLLELINADNDYRAIFEPLHDRWGVLANEPIPRYIRPDDDDPDLLAAVGRILLGKFPATRWTGRYNSRHFARQRVIKDVHSNLRLAWLATQFPDFPIILLVRHPCAVAASRLRAGFPTPNDRSLDVLLADQRLVEDHLLPFMDRLDRITGDFEREIARWCIETHVPLRQFVGLPNRGRISVFFYEELVGDTDAAVGALFSAAGRRPPIQACSAFRRFSQTTYRELPLDSPRSAVADWTSRVTADDVDVAMELLELFSLQGLYGRLPEPLATGADSGDLVGAGGPA